MALDKGSKQRYTNLHIDLRQNNKAVGQPIARTRSITDKYGKEKESKEGVAMQILTSCPREPTHTTATTALGASISDICVTGLEARVCSGPPLGRRC
jgi:hypothetical protein